MNVVKRQLAKMMNLKDRRGDFSSFNRRLDGLKNCHKGERCFIVGTGPSLNKTNLSLLKDEICFGVNTLYGVKPDCTYWVVCDYQLWKKKKDDIYRFVKSDILFLAEFVSVNLVKINSCLRPNDILIRSLGSVNVWDKVSTDLLKGTYSGGTVVVQAIQIAYYMGFRKIYLVGCDTDYSGVHHYDGSTCAEIGDANGRILSGDVEYVLNAYRQCKKAFESDNCKIYNATVGGKLEVFERKKLEEVI